MIERDVILRQIYELGQVLARVMSERTTAPRLAEEWAEEALVGALDLPTEALLELDRNELLAMAGPPERQVVLADLLREYVALLDGRGRWGAASRAAGRARWLYESAREAGAAVPLDLDARLEALRTYERP